MAYVLSLGEVRQFFYERVNKIKKEKKVGSHYSGCSSLQALLEGHPYERKNAGIVTIKCDACGKEFSRYKSRVMPNKFCSKTCFDQMRWRITGKFLKRREMRAMHIREP